MLAKADLLQTELDEKSNRLNQLEEDYESLSLKVEAENDAQQEWEEKASKKAEAHRKERAKLLDNLEIEKNKNRQYESTIASLKDTTQQGEMIKQVDTLKAEINSYRSELEASLVDKEQLEIDLEGVYRALEDANERQEERLMEAIAKERHQLKQLEVQVKEAKRNETEARSRYAELEAEKDEIEGRLNQAEDWNAVYEEGHGLKDAVRYQKKLKADLKRRDHDIASLSERLGVEMDKRKALETACQMLKEKAGLDRDFAFDDSEIKAAMEGDAARLQAENKELSNQIDMLEHDRLKLMKQLRDNAASIGEKGIRFWGLSAGQLMKVTEFATNLRDGVTTLPLDDQSLELLSKVNELELTVKTDKLTIERLEREISGLDSNYTTNSASLNPEILAMKELLEQLQQDNKQLRDTILNNHSSSAFQSVATNNNRLTMTAQIRQNIETVLQEPVAEMNPIAEAQLTRLHSAYEEMSDEVKHLKKQVERAANSQSTNADVARLSAEVAKMINLAHPNGVPGTSENNNGTQTPAHYGTTTQTPNTVSFGHTTKFPLKTPSTPGGQQMLSKQLSALSLPPEEWAEEVRELNGQLVECLEQLADREKELDDHEELLRRYEGHLGAMRQQTALLYKEHMEHSESAKSTEKRLNTAIDELRSERDSLVLRVQRYQELADLEEKESTNPSSIHKAIRDLTRRVTVHEVNEQKLARKYGSLQGQLQVEAESRVRAENNLIEAEEHTRKRILYLEQYKAHSIQLTERLQRQLDKSVPEAEHNKSQRELEMLREDYLDLLHKEADVRLRLTEQKELPRKVKRYQHKADELELALTRANSNCAAISEELEHQKMLTAMASSSNHNQDINTLVQEAARFRGEAARLELEFKSADATVKKLTQRTMEISSENDSLRERLRISDSHERHGRSLAEAARRKLLEIQAKYDKGLTAAEATELLEKQEFLMSRVESVTREVEKYRELADLASSQAASLEGQKSDHVQELMELQERCAEKESNTDDDAIIGRLQRQLLVAKQGYKDSMRKIENYKSNLRKKEAMSRMFEQRLDKREEALHKAREESRTQISSLKSALKELAASGGDAVASLAIASQDMAGIAAAASTNKNQSILEKAKILSAKVASITEASEKREEEFNECDEMRRRLESQVAELNTEKEVLEQLVADVQTAAATDVKSAVVAKRLIGLSEELRSNKLAALQARRNVQSLREEKRHLEGIISRHEDSIEMLEEAKAEAETKSLLSATGAGSENNINNAADINDVLMSTPGDAKLLLQLTPAGKNNANKLDPLVIDENGKGGSGPITELDEEDTLGVAQEFEDSRARRLRNKLEEMEINMNNVKEAKNASEETLQEYMSRCEALQRDVEYYKGMAVAGGGDGGGIDSPHNSSKNGGGGGNAQSNAKMAEAAHATILSLKQLLAEKNRVIERYKRKLADSKELSRRETAADRAEVERLTDKLYSENADAIEKLRNAVTKLERGGEGSIGGGAFGGDFKGGLVAQVEEAAALIGEKDDSLRQLELKLRTAEAARERAEARCGGALEEMERMKDDMVTLAAQLQDSEERVLEAMEDRSASKKIVELQNQLRSKEAKMSQLRQAVVRLKQAFMESEEARAAGEISARHNRVEGEGEAKELLKEEVSDMRSQLSSLIEEMAGAKQALSDAKSAKEKAERVLNKIKKENDKLEDDVSRLEGELRDSSDKVDDAVREKEEALGKMRRAVSKLKSKVGEATETGAEDKGRISELEKRIMVLTSQNLALRSAAAGQRLKSEKKEEEKAQESPVREVKSRGGVGMVGGERSRKDVEKKLLRRVEILEKRLEEKSAECEAALGASEQARKLMDKALKEKESANKGREKVEREMRGVRNSGIGDINSLEETRAKLFEVEEANVRLRRMAELEQPRTISLLKRELDESKVDKSDLEYQLKMMSDRMRGKKGGGEEGGLKGEEAEFLREEALREEVNSLKRAKRSLESKLLERDSDAMELKFELEQGGIDKSRMSRRVKELESALNASRRVNGSGSGRGEEKSGEREAGGRFKRERDLEGVVDALKRVVEKLKGENERLRRGAADSVRSAEADRKAKDATRKAQELMEENKSLRTRALAGDEATQRLAQRQDLVNQLRRQMKGRDEELKILNRKVEEAQRSKSLMVDEMEHNNKRTNQLERNLLEARRDAPGRGVERIGDEEAARKIEALRGELKEQHEVIKTLRESARGSAGGGGGGKESYALRQQIGDLKSQIAAVNRDKERIQRRAEAIEKGQRGGMGSMESQLLGENKKLKEQNAGLAKELQAFDLDFFEEIEDLKYKYNEAVSRLKQYER